MEQDTMKRLFEVHLNNEKIELLNNIVNDLQNVKNIMAIVLGGSYSTNKAHENSDLDIGIYYSNNTPFEIDEIKKVAKKYDKNKNPTVTNFYEWGHWVNGGSWIHNNICKTDILYRNIEQVKETIENAKRGIFENNYEQQPPFGFISIIYLAESKNCIPLYDPQNIIGKIKNDIDNYPKELKYSVIKHSLWQAEFTILQLDSFYNRNDMFSVYGCFTRALKYIIDVLFAINETYQIGYKNCLYEIELLQKKPKEIKKSIIEILTGFNNLADKINILKELLNEMKTLTIGIYNEKYKL